MPKINVLRGYTDYVGFKFLSLSSPENDDNFEVELRSGGVITRKHINKDVLYTIVRSPEMCEAIKQIMEQEKEATKKA